jgi:DNA-binding PucR family transcriptional regulator
MLDEDLDRARASAAMHIHRNTLLYRLSRIEELTGLDLRRPRDLAIAYLGARARDR